MRRACWTYPSISCMVYSPTCGVPSSGFGSRARPTQSASTRCGSTPRWSASKRIWKARVRALLRAADTDLLHPAEVAAVALVDLGGLDLGARVEGLVDDLAGQDLLQLGAHEGRALTGLDVLELDDGPQLATVELEDHAVLEIVRGSHGRTYS